MEYFRKPRLGAEIRIIMKHEIDPNHNFGGHNGTIVYESTPDGKRRPMLKSDTSGKLYSPSEGMDQFAKDEQELLRKTAMEFAERKKLDPNAVYEGAFPVVINALAESYLSESQ